MKYSAELLSYLYKDYKIYSFIVTRHAIQMYETSKLKLILSIKSHKSSFVIQYSVFTHDP